MTDKLSIRTRARFLSTAHAQRKIHWVSFQHPVDTIHSKKKKKNSKRNKNGAKMSWKSFQKIRKLLNFQKATIKPTIQEIPRRKSNGTEVRGEKLLKFSVHLVRLSSSPEILGNAFTFVTGKLSENSNGNFSSTG